MATNLSSVEWMAQKVREFRALASCYVEVQEFYTEAECGVWGENVTPPGNLPALKRHFFVKRGNEAVASVAGVGVAKFQSNLA